MPGTRFIIVYFIIDVISFLNCGFAVHFNWFEPNIWSLINHTKLALLIIVMSIFDVSWLLDGFLIGVSLTVGMILCEIAVVAPSADWSHVLSYSEWTLWVREVSISSGNLLVRQEFVVITPVILVQRIAINASKLAVSDLLLTGVSVLVEVFVQAYRHCVNWLDVWAIETLSDKVFVSVLSNETLAYLFNVLAITNWYQTWLDWSTSVINGLLIDPIWNTTHNTVSVWTFVTLYWEILAQSHLLELLWVDWTGDTWYIRNVWNSSWIYSKASLGLVWSSWSIHLPHVLVVVHTSDVSFHTHRAWTMVVFSGSTFHFLSFGFQDLLIWSH